MEHITLEEYKQLQQKGKSKYGNEEFIVDGITFDSKLEAKRWKELKVLQQANKITNLRRQVKFNLQPSYKKNGKTIKSINYIADFYYYDLKKRKYIVEDTKGFKTDVYKLKKKIFEYKYPELEITEIT
jgi:hypothetical protein